MNPQVADMDGDGDDDLIIGDRAGFVSYFERLDDGELAAADTLFEIYGGANTNPFVTDWNGDGYFDLLVAGIDTYGSKPCPVYLFENSGVSPYAIDSTTENLISVEAPLLDTIEKYRTIAMYDCDNDGLKDLLVGASFFNMELKKSSIKVRWSKNRGTAEKPLFTDYEWLLFGDTTNQEMSLPHFTATDYNNDGVVDLIFGASVKKGVDVQEQLWVWYGKLEETSVAEKVSGNKGGVAPITISGRTINLAVSEVTSAYLTLYNSLGKKIYQYQGITPKISLSSKLCSGVYHYQLQYGENLFQGTFILD